MYQGFNRHRKTIAMRKLLGTSDPIISLWLWSAENAANGDLSALTDDDVERMADWTGKRGRAVAAMVEVGFLDRQADGSLRLHNWAKRTGAGVESLLKTRERMKLTMRNRRANIDANVSANRVVNVDANEGNNPLPLSDLSSGRSTESDPEGDRVSESVIVNGRIRPRTAHDLITCLKIAIEREQPNNGMWNPGTFGAKDARAFLEGFGEQLEEAMEDIERRIVVFAKSPAMKPWTVSKFANQYNALAADNAAPSSDENLSMLLEHKRELEERRARGGRS